MFKKLAISTFTLLSLFPVNLKAAPVETIANKNIDSSEYSNLGWLAKSDRQITKDSLDRLYDPSFDFQTTNKNDLTTDNKDSFKYYDFDFRAARERDLAAKNADNLNFNSGRNLSTENIDHSIFQESLKIELTGARIVAKFAPENHLGEQIELAKLAAMMGYDRFSWVNYVEQDPYGIIDRQGQLLSTPYNDPPIGGYQYDAADELPFYWDVEECDGCRQRHHYQHPLISQKYQLVFEDIPSDPRLQPGEAIEFVTHLVGVKNHNSATKTAEWDVLNTFRWQLTNPTPGRGRVSLTENNIELATLSPFLLIEMQADGALLPSEIGIAYRPAFPTIDFPISRAIEESAEETIR